MTPLPDRFWAKVDITPACWLWTAALTSKGYGSFDIDGRRRSTHRLSYERLVAPIPTGLTIDHTCFVKRCVNPAHLEPVTQAENTRRAAARVTHCPEGHPYDVANLVNRKDGHRECRTCANARRRLHPEGMGRKIGAAKRWGFPLPQQISA